MTQSNILCSQEYHNFSQRPHICINNQSGGDSVIRVQGNNDVFISVNNRGNYNFNNRKNIKPLFTNGVRDKKRQSQIVHRPRDVKSCWVVWDEGNSNVEEECSRCLMPANKIDLKACGSAKYICRSCQSEKFPPRNECDGLKVPSTSYVEEKRGPKHECPICFEVIKSKARYCLNLHLICNECFRHMNQLQSPSSNLCPICRSEYPNDNICGDI